jgi:hypothetical protein
MAPTSPRHRLRQRQAATQQPYGAGGSSPKGVGVTSIPALGSPSAVEPRPRRTRRPQRRRQTLLARTSASAKEATRPPDGETTTAPILVRRRRGMTAPTRRGGGAAIRTRAVRRVQSRRGWLRRRTLTTAEGDGRMKLHDIMKLEGITGEEGIRDFMGHHGVTLADSFLRTYVEPTTFPLVFARGCVACAGEGTWCRPLAVLGGTCDMGSPITFLFRMMLVTVAVVGTRWLTGLWGRGV